MNTDGSFIAALLCEMSGLEGNVESSFTFNRCLRQESVEAPRLRQITAAQILASVEGKCKQKNMGLMLDFKQSIRNAALCGWTTPGFIMSHSKRNVEVLSGGMPMLKE